MDFVWMPVAIHAVPGLLAAEKASGYPMRMDGRENIEAVEFLRRFNTEIYKSVPGYTVDRRGVHLMAGRFEADVSWRTRLRIEVGHGVDE
jgi:hypothetical protein